jgi:hypothetical protein
MAILSLRIDADERTATGGEADCAWTSVAMPSGNNP